MWCVFEGWSSTPSKNIYDFGNNIVPEIIIEKKTMLDNWDKYVNSLKKIK